MNRRTFLSLIAVAPAGYAAGSPIEKAFDHLFNFEFAQAQAVTGESMKDPVAHCVRAAALLFSEFSRLNIWEGEDFFASGHRSKSKPDPKLRTAFFAAIEETRRLAHQSLESNSRDTTALLCQMMSYSFESNYVAYVERRSMASFDMCKKSQLWADKLLAADRKFHDAYLTTGLNEYMLGALPAMVRWAVKIETAKGDKQKGLQHLEMAARNGHYFPAFAKLLLAVFYEREKRIDRATATLRELSSSYPRNPLFTAQLARMQQKKS